MLSLNVSVPASKGMAVHIALHRLGLLRCLGWGARCGSALRAFCPDHAAARNPHAGIAFPNAAISNREEQYFPIYRRVARLSEGDVLTLG
jgi:hypothetical protein